MEGLWAEFLLGPFPGLLVALFTAGIPTWLAVRKLNATSPVDNAAKLSAAALEIVETYRTEVVDLRGELHTMKEEFDAKENAQDKQIALGKKRVTRLSRIVRDLYNGALMLVSQIEEQGLVPVWIPPASADELLTDIVNGD